MQLCTLILLLVGCTWADNTDGTTNANFYCPDLKPQASLDLQMIMGKWYTVEILEHKVDPAKPMNGARMMVVETCPVIKIRFNRDMSSLRLIWTEQAGNLEYSFTFPDQSGAPGLWLSAGSQNGTLVEKQYQQFSGTVQVMKAIAKHMVLTFCSRSPDIQLYSMLLSRDHILEKDNIKGVHNLLDRCGLTIVSVRETCTHGGASAQNPMALAWLAITAVLIAKFSI